METTTIMSECFCFQIHSLIQNGYSQVLLELKAHWDPADLGDLEDLVDLCHHEDQLVP